MVQEGAITCLELLLDDVISQEPISESSSSSLQDWLNFQEYCSRFPQRRGAQDSQKDCFSKSHNFLEKALYWADCCFDQETQDFTSLTGLSCL